jgi:hypothetical protein
MSRYLVTATVTYELDDINNPAEALDVFVTAVTADPTMDGVTLTGVQDVFATLMNDDGTPPHDPTISEWEEVNPFTRMGEEN